MFQMNHEEIIAAGILNLSAGIPRYTKAEFKIQADRARAGGMASFEWMVRKKDGSLLWTDISITNAFLEGEPRMLAVIRDIDDRKKAEEKLARSESLFSNLMDQSRETVILCNSQGVIIIFNKAAEYLTGVSSEDALNHPIWQAIPQILPGRAKKIVKSNRLERLILEMIANPDGEIHRYSGKWVRDHEDIYYMVSIYPIIIPNDMMINVSIHDIS